MKPLGGVRVFSNGGLSIMFGIFLHVIGNEFDFNFKFMNMIVVFYLNY